MERFFFILKDGAKVECENLLASDNGFMISDDDTIKYLPDAVAIEHTHPDQSVYLSTADRICQISTGLEFLLHGRKYRPCLPLLGRTFEHGINDCFSLMRDFYMLATGHDLKDYARSPNWWANGENLYLDNLEAEKFYQVDKCDIMQGDLILISLLSNVPNHAALYLGDGVILHHLPDRLSKRDIYGSRYRKLTNSVWRFKQWQPLDYTGIYQDLALNLR